MSGTPIKNEFKAWIDKLPRSGNNLIVVGQVKFPTGGWKVELREAEPQGTVPSTLILELVEIAPTGSVIQRETLEKAEFNRPDGDKYTHVTICSHGSKWESFTIEVGEAH